MDRYDYSAELQTDRLLFPAKIDAALSYFQMEESEPKPTIAFTGPRLKLVAILFFGAWQSRFTLARERSMKKPTVKTIGDIMALDDASGPRVHEWSAWAMLHIISAATLSRLAGEIETSSNRDNKAVLEHRALVTGAILISVTFLESSINELFAEAKANPFATVRQLGPTIIERLASQAAESFLKKAPFLSKYQRVLRLAGKPNFNQGERPYSEVDALRKLRVELHTYRPNGDMREPSARVPIQTRQSIGWPVGFPEVA